MLYSQMILPHLTGNSPARKETSFDKSLINRVNSKSSKPICILDLRDVEAKYTQWVHLLPRVKPHYATKCNPNKALCQQLAMRGCNFDCASASEIELIASLGVSSDRIIYANPCKPDDHVRYARSIGVHTTVFDDVDELDKLKECHPDANLLLRIRVDDSHSVCPLNRKFGADIAEVKGLLEHAKALNMKVVGVAFHVGSGCMNASAYHDALLLARTAFDIALSVGMRFSILDIGGGFPGTWKPFNGEPTFKEFAHVINASLSQLFPDPSIYVLAEPGRYFACSSCTLITKVISAKKKVIKGITQMSYYLNDGLYGSFNCKLFDHYTPIPCPLTDMRHAPVHLTTMYGPTCDSLDTIVTGVTFPELKRGDFVVFPNMGAYTLCAASRFNGFEKPELFYVTAKDHE